MRKDPVVNRGIMGFFQTTAGRNIAFFATGATTLGLFVVNYLPHTMCLKYYKDFVQCYQNGIPRPVPDKVKARLDKALDILQLQEYQRKIIKPFTVFGFDLFLAGSTKYRFGAALGIPVNYSYSEKEEVNRHDIRFRDQTIQWNTEAGNLLLDAIVLSEDEQLFGLCKSILQLQTHRVLLNSVFPSVSFLTVYTIGHYLNARMNLFARPFSLRLVMYSILGLFGFGTWSFMKDFNQVSYDTEIDKQLCSLGPKFVEAGASYYDKLLKKNMALRELIGDDTYTAKGNENYFIRQKSLPLTIHKSYFEEKLRELRQSSEGSAEIPN
ncbi:PREDICTED: transmembrane protein 177 [Rhagoletis zephyria]|uniref:transmembrane protein 177 n=1 Tax=Rhagoletis zephyria TaxID=28612 RepID=UPI00081130B9|nr:PREDICTED: transmembrane protein 177 [Rhagoletis zephyria]